MALSNYVKFLRGTPKAYAQLTSKDADTLYFISEKGASTGTLYLGNMAIAGGSVSAATTLNDLTAHEVEINTNKTYGNIGVTTSQQMLQSEIDLRKQHLIRQYIDRFCKDYMFYVGGDYCVYSYILP